MQNNTIDKSFVISIMNRLDFFKNFSAEEKESLVHFYQHIVSFQAGEVIIHDGDRDDTTFFILLSGEAVVTKGRQCRPIARLSPGDFFGEISFLTKTPRTATVTAEMELIVIKVDETMIRELGPPVREKIKDNIIAKLVERLRRMNELVERLSI
ncbi:MAG: cyclic nucleotide-binding domain-containing protein [Thermodesulfobacteriota bacterium]